MGEIYLEPEKIIKNAEEIAEKSKNDEKFVFRIQYESAARQVVLAEISRLDCEIINQSDSDSTVTVRISMPQLAAIKTLNCIENVDTAEEIGTENTVNKKVLHNVEKYDTISIKTENEPDLSASVQMDTNSAIAPLCYGGGSSCIDNSNTMQTAHYLPLALWKEGSICCPGAEQWYRFTASISEADTYTIYTSGSLDTVGYLYDANGTLLASNDDSNGNRNFKITRQLTTGSRYYVKVKAFANNIGDYELRVDYTVRSSSCGGTSCDENKESASELVVNRWQSGEICCPCAVKWYKFTPQSSAYYTIYTVGSLDTVGALYDANDNLIKSNDDGGQGLNFKLVSYLTAGQTYYIKVNAFGNKTGRYSIAAISAVFVESVSITDPYITLNKGETAVLTTEVLPSYATNKSLWWQSGDNNIVTVSPEGVITAVDGGTTNVIATTRDSSGRSGCCTVTVNVPVESVKVNDERRIMYTGTTDRFEVTVCPHNATNKLVRWSSTNTNVATVDPATGKITAISAGTARIIATAQDGTGKSGACELTVKPAIPVEGVTIGSSTYTMKVGETMRLSYSVYPVDATNQRVTWCSSDPNVAEVGSRNRKITAKRAGKTTITVTTDDGNFVASCEVTVDQVLEYPDTLIDDSETKKRIIRLKTLIDENQRAFLDGKISECTKNTIHKQLSTECDVARADYIVVGSNPTSDYAYEILGGDQSARIPFSFSTNLTLNSKGLAVIVVQRALEILGYYEPKDQENYGVFDANTYDAACLYPALMSFDKSINQYVFDNASFNVIFRENTADLRKFSSFTELNKLRTVHDIVAKWSAGKVGGTYRMYDNKIINGNLSNNYYGYADVLKMMSSCTYLWEVKPDKERYYKVGGIGERQVNRYLGAAEKYDQNFPKPLVIGYNIGEFTIPYISNKYINVRNFNNPATSKDVRNCLILYKIDDSAEHLIEAKPVFVDKPSESYNYDYSYSFDTLSWGVVTVVGMAIVLGAACVILSGPTGGTSLIPLTLLLA